MDIAFLIGNGMVCRTEEECEELLLNLRWANGFHCPNCDHHEAYHIHTRKLLECKECRMQVSITAGTIMHKSKLPLLTWFRAIQILFQQGIGMTGYALSELLHINYRSAKLLLQKINLALKIEEDRLESFRKAKESRQSSQAGSSETSGNREKKQVKHSIKVIAVESGVSFFRATLKKLVSIYLYSRFFKCYRA